jgi:Flp pilus assembly pilin Flp
VDIWQSLVDFGQIVIVAIGQLVDAVSSLFSQVGSVVNEMTE